jgi:hypothetical protein
MLLLPVLDARRTRTLRLTPLMHTSDKATPAPSLQGAYAVLHAGIILHTHDLCAAVQSTTLAPVVPLLTLRRTTFMTSPGAKQLRQMRSALQRPSSSTSPWTSLTTSPMMPSRCTHIYAGASRVDPFLTTITATTAAAFGVEACCCIGASKHFHLFARMLGCTCTPAAVLKCTIERNCGAVSSLPAAVLWCCPCQFW